MILLTALACFGSTPSDPTPEPPVDKPVVVTPDTPPVEDAPLSQAERDAGFEAKCANGQLVVAFWSGEYPHPVVQVNSPVSAKVRDSQCGTATRACTVPAGLYHPWATEPDKPAGAEFNTLTKPLRYTNSAGSELVVLTYLAEGACLMQIDGGEVSEDMCPGTTDGDGWIQDEAKPMPDVQLMRVACTNGAPGWVHVDEAFMATDGVVEGEMVGWGEVSKSQ